MDKQNLSEKLKNLRISKGFSQEQLCESSGISVRTIQRIESGKSLPNGDTLKKIATALEEPVDNLVFHRMKVDKGILLILSLSSISYIIHPFLGIIVPAIIWYVKRDTVLYADKIGRKLISFQVTWQLIFFGFIFIVVGSHGLRFYNYNISELAFNLDMINKVPGSIKITTLTSYFIWGIYFMNLFIGLLNVLLIQYDRNPRYFISVPFMWKDEN